MLRNGYFLPSFDILISVALLLGLFVAWLILRRRQNKKFATLIVLLAFFYGLATVASMVVIELNFRYLIIAWPLSLVSSIIGTIAALLLAYRGFTSYIFSSGSTPDISDPAVLRSAVSKILDSEFFLTALRSTLPQGKDDHQYGLDFIPYMLNSIDERRKRVTTSARMFLFATVLAALLFSSVVMYFGYVLLNESSAGTARSLADISRAAESMSQALQLTIPSYYANPKFKQDVAPSLERLAEIEPGNKNKKIQDNALDALNHAKSSGDYTPLSAMLTQATAEVSKDGVQERVYEQALMDASNRMKEFTNSQSMAFPEVARRTADLKVLITKADDILNKPENRIPDIIKRLALGLVVSTFFLALLRYLGNLYRTCYQQVLEAEKDDFMVRKFYVAIKNSLTSDAQREAVLTSFMAANNTGAGEKEISDDATKQEFEVIKELFSALSKKL